MNAKGMITTTLALQLAEAVLQDERPEEGGFDLSAGLFGSAVSDWIRATAQNIAENGEEIARLRAELAEARKPDCRQCSYHYACAKLERYPCDNGEDFVLHNLRGPLRLYEKEGK